jgi:hypothetical protein
LHSGCEPAAADPGLHNQNPKLGISPTLLRTHEKPDGYQLGDVPDRDVDAAGHDPSDGGRPVCSTHHGGGLSSSARDRRRRAALSREGSATAAAQDHAERVPPPNDVWIRNQSHLLRTLSVTSTAPITVNDLGAVITHSSVKNLQVTLARLGQFPDLNGGIFWLTVRHGVVTQIAEQYLP